MLPDINDLPDKLMKMLLTSCLVFFVRYFGNTLRELRPCDHTKTYGNQSIFSYNQFNTYVNAFLVYWYVYTWWQTLLYIQIRHHCWAVSYPCNTTSIGFEVFLANMEPPWWRSPIMIYLYHARLWLNFLGHKFYTWILSSWGLVPRFSLLTQCWKG